MLLRTLDLRITDVDGAFLFDPSVIVRLRAGSGHVEAVRVALGGQPATVSFDGPAGSALSVHVEPSRYRHGAVQALVDGDGRVIPAAPLVLPRIPDTWSAVFTPWSQLATEFTAFKTLLRESCEFRLGRDASAGQIIEDRYDADIPGDSSRGLAKMCLLNLCARLRHEDIPGSDGSSWLSEIEQLLVAQRDRCFAEVSATFFDAVKALSKRAAGGYGKSNAENHRKNLVKVPEVERVGAMFSIKSKEAKGNIQLTVGEAVRRGRSVFLLDADIDERGRLLGHTFEVIRNKLTGHETEPIDIHEGLRRAFPGLTLGYRLEPRVLVGQVTARVILGEAAAAAPEAAPLAKTTARGRRARATLARTFVPRRIAVLGDSVTWGQGLLHPQKIATLVAEAYAAGGTVPAVRVAAHSGAIIGVGVPGDGEVCDGEVPAARPSILGQVNQFPKADAAKTDLVLIDGGINDVDVRLIVNPFTDPSTLADRTTRACGSDLVELLMATSTRFAKARIAVLTYYPILSVQSRFELGPQILMALGAPLPVLMTSTFDVESLWSRILDNCRVFHKASSAAIAQAVAEANRRSGTSRCVLVDPDFKDRHAALAPEARLFGINWDLSPEDPIAAERRKACNRCESNPFSRLQCHRASAGHPNPVGAAAYARAVLSALDEAVAPVPRSPRRRSRAGAPRRGPKKPGPGR